MSIIRKIKALNPFLIVVLVISTIVYIPSFQTKTTKAETISKEGSISFPIKKANLSANALAQFGKVTLNPNNVKSPYADEFPGKVPDNAKKVYNKTIKVNYDYRDLSYLRMSGPPGTWISTGLYAPAGSVITVKVPEGTKNLDVQVGSHTDNLMNLDTWNRAPIVVGRQALMPGINKINSPFGGLIYLIPTKPKKHTTVQVSISGAVNAPYFILGKTTDKEWKNTIKNYPAPWAELQSRRVVLTIPSEDIRKLDNPKELMTKWDEIVSSYDELIGVSQNQAEPNQSPDRPFRYVADIQITNGWMHSGYPIMLHQGESSKGLVDIETIQHNGWGYWHELGHDYQQSPWYWRSVIEVTTNLHSLHIQTKYGNKSRLVTNKSYDNALTFVNNTNSNKDFNDDKHVDVFTRLVMFYQLKLAYGWNFYTKLHIAYREMPTNELPKTEQQKIDEFVVMASKTCRENLLEFFYKWGLKYSEDAKQKVMAMNLPQPKKQIWTLKE